ncbi:hypothetical protein [Streptomyces sp. NPDC047841]|uniref:hypothetical protein n=1 Tax=Streptomyces sp. NPDC047841 TaxID=3154708 RepID=UPI003452EE31
MDIARLVLEYVKTLAWPLIVLFIALAFKDEFRRLLDRLKEVKGGGFGATFGDGIREARSAAQAAAEEAAATEAEDQPTEDMFNTFRDVAKATPEGAVLAAWGAVERKLTEAVRAVSGTDNLTTIGTRSTPTALITYLGNAGLNPMAVVALNNLRVLRNRAAHPAEGVVIDAAEARSYVDTAELGVRLLNSYIAGRQEPHAA